MKMNQNWRGRETLKKIFKTFQKFSKIFKNSKIQKFSKISKIQKFSKIFETFKKSVFVQFLTTSTKTFFLEG